MIEAVINNRIIYVGKSLRLELSKNVLNSLFTKKKGGLVLTSRYVSARKATNNNTIH